MTAPRLDSDFEQGRTKVAAAVVVGHAVKHVYNSSLRGIVLPEIKIGLGLSRSQFGSLATARALTGGVATFAAGFLGDRFSNRAGLMLGISLALMGVAQLAAGYAPSYWTMLAVFVFVGIGPSMFHPPAVSALSRRFPDRRGFAISLHGTGGIAGEVIGPLMGAGLLTVLMWRDLLKISVVPAILAGVLIWAMLRSARTQEQQDAVFSFGEYMASLGALLRNPVLLVLVAATALRSIGESAISDFLPVYLREDLAFSPTKVAIYLSVARATGLVVQPVLGSLSDRYSRRAVLLPGVTVSALLGLALAAADPGFQLTAVVVVSGALSFSLHHIFIAAAMDATRGEVQSTVVALIYGAGFAGTFSPLVAGLISDRYGIHSAFLYGGSVMLVAAALMLVARPSADAPLVAESKAGARPAG